MIADTFVIAQIIAECRLSRLASRVTGQLNFHKEFNEFIVTIDGVMGKRWRVLYSEVSNKYDVFGMGAAPAEEPSGFYASLNQMDMLNNLRDWLFHMENYLEY